MEENIPINLSTQSAYQWLEYGYPQALAMASVQFNEVYESHLRGEQPNVITLEMSNRGKKLHEHRDAMELCLYATEPDKGEYCKFQVRVGNFLNTPPSIWLKKVDPDDIEDDAPIMLKFNEVLNTDEAEQLKIESIWIDKGQQNTETIDKTKFHTKTWTYHDQPVLVIYSTERDLELKSAYSLVINFENITVKSKGEDIDRKGEVTVNFNYAKKRTDQRLESSDITFDLPLFEHPVDEKPLKEALELSWQRPTEKAYNQKDKIWSSSKNEWEIGNTLVLQIKNKSDKPLSPKTGENLEILLQAKVDKNDPSAFVTTEYYMGKIETIARSSDEQYQWNIKLDSSDKKQFILRAQKKYEALPGSGFVSFTLSNILNFNTQNSTTKLNLVCHIKGYKSGIISIDINKIKPTPQVLELNAQPTNYDNPGAIKLDWFAIGAKNWELKTSYKQVPSWVNLKYKREKGVNPLIDKLMIAKVPLPKNINYELKAQEISSLPKSITINPLPVKALQFENISGDTLQFKESMAITFRCKTQGYPNWKIVCKHRAFENIETKVIRTEPGTEQPTEHVLALDWNWGTNENPNKLPHFDELEFELQPDMDKRYIKADQCLSARVSFETPKVISLNANKSVYTYQDKLKFSWKAKNFPFWQLQCGNSASDPFYFLSDYRGPEATDFMVDLESDMGWTPSKVAPSDLVFKLVPLRESPTLSETASISVKWHKPTISFDAEMVDNVLHLRNIRANDMIYWDVVCTSKNYEHIKFTLKGQGDYSEIISFNKAPEKSALDFTLTPRVTQPNGAIKKITVPLTNEYRSFSVNMEKAYVQSSRWNFEFKVKLKHRLIGTNGHHFLNLTLGNNPDAGKHKKVYIYCNEGNELRTVCVGKISLYHNPNLREGEITWLNVRELKTKWKGGSDWGWETEFIVHHELATMAYGPVFWHLGPELSISDGKTQRKSAKFEFKANLLKDRKNL